MAELLISVLVRAFKLITTKGFLLEVIHQNMKILHIILLVLLLRELSQVILVPGGLPQYCLCNFKVSNIGQV